MTDAIVTQLHPASPCAGETPRRKSKDVTGPLRSRRARQKCKTATKTIEMGTSHLYEKPSAIKADDTALRWVPWSVWPLAGTTVGLMAVSLTLLSDGVSQLTAIPPWQAWAMAVGIDCMLISVALAQLTAPPDVKGDIAIVARCHSRRAPPVNRTPMGIGPVLAAVAEPRAAVRPISCIW